jgi:hypothetical protein
VPRPFHAAGEGRDDDEAAKRQRLNDPPPDEGHSERRSRREVTSSLAPFNRGVSCFCTAASFLFNAVVQASSTRQT